MHLISPTIILSLLIPYSLAWSVSILFLDNITQNGDRCDGDITAVCRALPEQECCDAVDNDFVVSAVGYAVYQDGADDSCPNGREEIAVIAYAGQAVARPCGTKINNDPTSACVVQDFTTQGANWVNNIVRRPRRFTKRASKECRKPDYFTWRVDGTVYEAGPEAYEFWRNKDRDGPPTTAGAAGTLGVDRSCRSTRLTSPKSMLVRTS